MISFKEYITENSVLHVFDVDDTLVHSDAKIHVKDKAGNNVKALTPSEFNTHKLHPDHHYDYGEFRSSAVFSKSRPIKKMIRTINAAQNTTKKNPKNKVIINTARADLDNKDKFLKTLGSHGIKQIDQIHVHRAGNIPGGDAAQKKLVYIRQHLDNHPYSHVRMYDDSEENLNAFLGLKHEYPNTRFHAYHVSPDGTMKKHPN